MNDTPKYVGAVVDPNVPSLMMQGKVPDPVKYVVTCPRCGSPSVSVDAAARWNVETQEWEMSSAFDSKTCDSCLYEGDSFYNTPLSDITPNQKAFLDGEVEDYQIPPEVKL